MVWVRIKSKNSAVVALHLRQDFGLLLGGQLREGLAEAFAAGGIHAGDSLPVGTLVLLVVPGQLQVDEVDHAGLRGAGVRRPPG